jgi:hypothetical protein
MLGADGCLGPSSRPGYDAYIHTRAIVSNAWHEIQFAQVDKPHSCHGWRGFSVRVHRHSLNMISC